MQIIQYSLLTTLLPVAFGRNDIHTGRHVPSESSLGNMLLATSGRFVSDLSQCPTLKPRINPPKNIHDLYVLSVFLS